MTVTFHVLFILNVSQWRGLRSLIKIGEIGNILSLLEEYSRLYILIGALFLIVLLFLIILGIFVIIALIEGREIKVGFIKIGQRQKNEIKYENNTEITFIKEKLSNLDEDLKLIEKYFSQKFDYVERLTVLPNFEFPPSALLKRISNKVSKIYSQLF